MKNKLTQNLLIAAIAGTALITTVDAQNRDKPGGGRQIGGQSNRGAPNSLRDRDRDGNANRQTVRKPYGGRERDGDNARKPKPGQGRKPGTGMGRVDKPGQNGQKPKPKPNLKELLDLTEEQAKTLRAAREEWHILAKSVRDNKELSDEEKRTQLKEGHKEFDAKIREILTEEQYSKFREIRRQNAQPNNNERQHRRELRQILELTEEQVEKLRAVHQYAIKKIKAIIANEELTKEEKKKQIKNVKKQAHNRRMEIFTEEQKEKLRKWRAHHRAQHQQQGDNQTGGQQNRPRPQQGGEK